MPKEINAILDDLSLTMDRVSPFHISAEIILKSQNISLYLSRFHNKSISLQTC